MPTYHYRCPACRHEFERFHKMSVKAAPKCPKCGRRTERVISGGAGLVFKGSGFYITDYKRSEKKTGDEAAAKPEKPEKPAKTEAAASSDKPAKSSKSSGAES
ncbi:MAG TPA: FmdB family zinc ribbon protein [Gemmatimonadales bacterium]|nr:FmdB family zinc ribbon protein [Gemmatimonadales bacterium]